MTAAPQFGHIHTHTPTHTRTHTHIQTHIHTHNHILTQGPEPALAQVTA